MSAHPQDRLQPALLDRLCDDARTNPNEPDERRVMTKQQIRAAVLRDLSWLFNAVQPLAGVVDADSAVAGSVLNYGLPPISGQLASRVDVSVLEGQLRNAIERFEPRILAETLSVRALETESVLDAHNIIEFEIRGFLWAQPVPLELLLRTQLDLEIGQVLVKDASGVAVGSAG